MFNEADGLRYYSFDYLQPMGVIHGIFTRHGGVSPAPWDSLNLGGTLGDERQNIIENRRRIFNVFGRPVESIFDVWQVHGTEIICADEPRPLNAPHQKADAILTNRPGISLFMRFADCVPILLYDPVKRVVGIVHAGWQGTVNKIAALTIRAMQKQYGSYPPYIFAGIGPSIGPDHYEVGPEVMTMVRKAFGETADLLISQKDRKPHFDLWKANILALNDEGVEHIILSSICTTCNSSDWYSHRGEHGRTGRFAAIIALSDQG